MVNENSQKGNWITELLKNKIVKVITIIALCLFVFVFGAAGLRYVWDDFHGVHDKFLWLECNIPAPQVDTLPKVGIENSSHPIIKLDTTSNVSSDTQKFIGSYHIKNTSIKSIKHTIPSTKNVDTAKNSSTQVNTNNGINSGNIGGENNTVNNFGTPPRLFPIRLFDSIARKFPGTGRQIVFKYMGAPTSEMKNVMAQFIVGLKKVGYTNIYPYPYTDISSWMPNNVVIKEQKNGDLYIFIPPQ